MLVFVSGAFSLFWIAYRHNYYFVQRNKVDTHGLLFNSAISQLFAGIYVLEIALIGLFFLVRDSKSQVACGPQAIIMIVVLVLTVIFHLLMEQHLRPLYEFLPVTLEDRAVDAERERLRIHSDSDSSRHEASRDSNNMEMSDLKNTGPLANGGTTSQTTLNPPTSLRARATTDASRTAASARLALSHLKRDAAARVRVRTPSSHLPGSSTSLASSHSHRRSVADALGAAIASYPDELIDLSPEEREAELKAAFQDPVTREPAPVIWIPMDEVGVSGETVKGLENLGYGQWLRYSNEGAVLTKKGKCEVTMPAPDVRPDWLMDWAL